MKELITMIGWGFVIFLTISIAMLIYSRNKERIFIKLFWICLLSMWAALFGVLGYGVTILYQETFWQMSIGALLIVISLLHIPILKSIATGRGNMRDLSSPICS